MTTNLNPKQSWMPLLTISLNVSNDTESSLSTTKSSTLGPVLQMVMSLSQTIHFPDQCPPSARKWTSTLARNKLQLSFSAPPSRLKTPFVHCSGGALTSTWNILSCSAGASTSFGFQSLSMPCAHLIPKSLPNSTPTSCPTRASMDDQTTTIPSLTELSTGWTPLTASDTIISHFS